MSQHVRLKDHTLADMFISANAVESEKSNAVVMREEVVVASIVEALVMLAASSCVYVRDSPDIFTY